MSEGVGRILERLEGEVSEELKGGGVEEDHEGWKGEERGLRGELEGGGGEGKRLEGGCT